MNLRILQDFQKCNTIIYRLNRQLPTRSIPELIIEAKSLHLRAQNNLTKRLQLLTHARMA